MNRFGSVTLTLAVLMVLMLGAAASTGAGGSYQLMDEQVECNRLCDRGCLNNVKKADCSTFCSTNCPKGTCGDNVIKRKKPHNGC
ncbi:hypothetical protein OROGR_029961 [Orobanche gracilis]